jgi:hypothetical protein
MVTQFMEEAVLFSTYYELFRKRMATLKHYDSVLGLKLLHSRQISPQTLI